MENVTPHAHLTPRTKLVQNYFFKGLQLTPVPMPCFFKVLSLTREGPILETRKSRLREVK